MTLHSNATPLTVLTFHAKSGGRPGFDRPDTLTVLAEPLRAACEPFLPLLQTSTMLAGVSISMSCIEWTPDVDLMGWDLALCLCDSRQVTLTLQDVEGDGVEYTFDLPEDWTATGLPTVVDITLNTLDDDGIVVDTSTMPLNAQQLSPIVDEAAQLVLMYRDGLPLDGQLEALDEALQNAGVLSIG